jgi:DNA-binding MarR family transcriptional regulator
VVNDSLEETELARLLAQLLRVVSPAPSAGPADTATHPGPAAGAHPAPARSGGAAPAGDPAPPNGTSGWRPGHEPAPAPDGPDDGPASELSGLAAISTSEARALIELVAARGIAQGELGGLLGLEKSTVSRLAAGLERKGWIRRGRDGDNQRYVRLYLTAQGRAVADRVLNAWQSRQERVLAALTADERAGLEVGLRGLVRGLAAERVAGEPPGDEESR